VNRIARLIDTIEEQTMVCLLGVMTLITFANVVSRYVFNTNILWALEVTVFLFAWMVILGSSYALKKSAHLGFGQTLPSSLQQPDVGFRRVLRISSEVKVGMKQPVHRYQSFYDF